MLRFAAFLLTFGVPLATAMAASLEVRIFDSTGKPLRDAVAYAMPASGPVEAKAAKTVAVEQVDREFVPYVSVIQTGTPVTFPNRDAILHHVYSFAPVKTFEIKLYRGKSPSEIRFDKPGLVTLGCNIHDWMIAYILVVSTPHFARTDENGVARLRDLPSGGFEVRAWHPQQVTPAQPQRVTLDAAAQSRATFGVEVNPRRSKYKPPLDRLRY